MRKLLHKRRWQAIAPAILVALVLVLGPVASAKASVQVAQAGAVSPTQNALLQRDGNTVLLTAAAVVVVAATAFATTTTDVVVATELTVFTEVAARTTGELGDPLPVNPDEAGRTSRAHKHAIAHHEFDH